MTSPVLNNENSNDELNLDEVFVALKANKKFISIILSLFLCISLIYSLTKPNIYTAKAVLHPTIQDSYSNALNQYGGLASLAGIGIPNNSGTESEIALALVKSKKMVSQLMLKESFLPDLMAAKKWSLKNGSLTYDSNQYDIKKKSWVRDFKAPFSQTPSTQEAFVEFSKKVWVSQDGKNQLITISVDHMSPIIAQQWVAWIVEEANSIVADMKVKELQASNNYLNDQIRITPYAELRTMFYELIQSNTQKMMLAKVNPEYALTTIDPALVPEIKSKPNRILIVIMSVIFGLIASISFILIRLYLFKKYNEFKIF